MSRPTLVLLALCLVGADWPRFRGPNGTGQSDDRDVPVTWQDKNFLWKTPLPGTGHSSPIIVKGRAYLLAATADERLVVCIDAKSGKELWTKKVSGGVGKTHAKSSLASATPCSDGERVYCVFWDGKKVGLYAYTLDGEPAWEHDLGKFSSQHGPGFSPIVHGGLVIVNNDQDGTSVLEAFHARTGKPAWQVKRKPFRSCYSTPFLLETQNGPELVVGSTAGLTRYRPSDGKELWHFTWAFSKTKPLRTIGSPVAADGLVFLGAGDGDGSRAMIAVKLDGKDDVSKTNLAWDKETGTPYVPSMLLHGGHVYTVTDAGAAVCYEAKTGKETWRAPRMAGATSASPLLIDGKIFAIDEKGAVYVIAARPDKFEVLARSKMGENVSATPAVSDGRLYVRGEKHLICVGKP